MAFSVANVRVVGQNGGAGLCLVYFGAMSRRGKHRLAGVQPAVENNRTADALRKKREDGDLSSVFGISAGSEDWQRRRRKTRDGEKGEKIRRG